MTKQSLKSITLLALPLALLSACGEVIESDPQSESEINNDTNEHITLSSAQIIGANTPHMLQPIQVAVTADVSAAAYETNINVGLRTTDGSFGCVLGAMGIDPAEGEQVPSESDALTTWSSTAEFIIGAECALLVGRDDLELFVGFDPWHELDGESYFQALEEDPQFNLLNIVSASAVSVEGCASCATTYELHDVIGLDAELRELNLSSVVAVIPVAAEGGAEPVQTSTQADFSLTIGSRVVGLDKAASLDEGLVRRVHHIRPLGSDDVGLPLVDVIDGRHIYSHDVVVPGPSVVTTSAPLYIEDETRDAIVDGAWSNIEEFELVTCLETDFDQAVFAGEDLPRANDCGAIPVVIVRQVVDINGLPLPSSEPGAANSRIAQVYTESWGANAGYGFGYSGLSFKAWLDVNSSDGPSATYGGVSVSKAGAWYEAGVRADATVFNRGISLVNIYGTIIGYDFDGGKVAMGASLIGHDFIPEFEIEMADGVPLSLQQIFDAAGVDADPSLTLSYPIIGKTFDDGCDDVGAGVSLDASVGLDTDMTSLMARTTYQGVEVTGTFAPYFDLTVAASANTGSFLGISAGISAWLTLLRITLPFTVTAEVIDFDPLAAVRLNFTESAGALFNTLSGGIDFVFKYKNFWGTTITHAHNIAHWDGLSAYKEFFVLTQRLNIGSEISTQFCTNHADFQLVLGDFDGDGTQDYLCHRGVNGNKRIDFGGAYDGQDWSNFAHGGCLDTAKLVVGDFNGDGRDDLFCRGEDDQTTWVEFADPNGHFAGGGAWTGSARWCTGSNRILRTGDYNQDGRDDLLCYRASDGQKWIDYADQDGLFGQIDWSGTGPLPQG